MTAGRHAMSFLDDLSVARRRLVRAPGFAALAVVTLALGIGAHTAIFGLVDRLFLRDLPVAEPDRLVGIYESRDGAGFFPLSLPDYRDDEARATVFTGLAAHYPTAPLTLELGEALEEVNGSVVSPSYFDVLGLAPARGRFFLPEEGEAAEAGAVAGLPSEVWVPTAMAGVGYRGCDPADRDCTWVKMIGRLAPGRTLEEARAEMAVLGRAVRRTHPSGGEVERGLATALVVGAVPGIQAARPSLVPALKDDATAGAAGPGKRRPTLLGLLVVAQVALSFVLLTSTGLLVRSLAAADRVGGVDPDSVTTLRLRPLLVGHGPERAQGFTREVVDRLEALPGGPPADALGRLLETGGRAYEVVGVVEDRAYRSLGQVAPPVAYVPYWQDPTMVDARIAVLAGGAAEPLLPALRAAVHALDPEVPVTEVETLRRRIDRSLAPVHLASRVLAASGALALGLCAIGLYGLLSLAVARRTREIGIRMALGGTRGRVVGAVVRKALTLVAVALALGAAAALLVQPALGHYLYGVGPRDPASFAAALAVLALAAALASWWPARRAARVDPLVALRRE